MSHTNIEEQCYCGLEKPYAECCEPFIKGDAQPSTAEATMRSRYSAFVVSDIDYILATHHPSTVDEVKRDEVAHWSEQSTWGGLEIHDTDAGQPTDERGIVVFTAHYDLDGEHHHHFEHSEFIQEDGRWYFLNADGPKSETIRREEPKVGRNDPCPCGSGKKYKRCHGAA